MSEQLHEEKKSNVTENRTQQDMEQKGSDNFREISYFVMFIGAVFVVNAMETGSYRTPWSVAIITTLAGLGLFGYSRYLQSRKQ